jgi:hypothetical protein
MGVPISCIVLADPIIILLRVVSPVRAQASHFNVTATAYIQMYSNTERKFISWISTCEGRNCKLCLSSHGHLPGTLWHLMLHKKDWLDYNIIIISSYRKIEKKIYNVMKIQ